MSWDIYVQDFGTFGSLDEIPDDFRPQPLGQRSEIVARIKEIAPRADFQDASWGTFEEGNGSIEINIGKDEVCKSFMLHVRGGADGFRMTASLLRHLGFRAVDMESGEFFEEEAARQSFEEWVAYRDQILGKQGEPRKPNLIQRISGIFK